MSGGKLPRVTVGQAQRALQRGGWVVKRQGADHLILTHGVKGGRVSMPRHPSKPLLPKTLLSILEQAGLTVQEFRELL
jgi:predicted RNA binding protein YcfA (HicA-like mRNA interferase family)